MIQTQTRREVTIRFDCIEQPNRRIMEVIEAARQLGEALMQDERAKRLQLAKAANDADTVLQGMIGEFNLKKLNYQNLLQQENVDREKVSKVEGELKELYTKIMENDTMKAFENAKKEMDELIGHINSIIQVSVSGEVSAEGGCSGQCSGCAGCH